MLGRRAATGETETRPRRNHQELKLAAHHDAIRAEIAQGPDATLNELRARLWSRHGVAASLGLRHRTGPAGPDAEKKSLRTEEQERPELARQGADWRAGQARLNPQRLVFVDETGAATNMARRYGRGPRGRRVGTARTWEGHDLRRRPDQSRLRRPPGHRRGDERRELPRLGRADAGTGTTAGRHRHHGQPGRPPCQLR